MGLNPPTSITLFIPCLMDVFYPNMAQDLMVLLKNLGFSPKYPQAQTCFSIVMGAHGHKELHVVTLLFPITGLGSKGDVQC